MSNKTYQVLFVEDDADHAELILRAFQTQGVDDRIIHVTDGRMALDYLFRRGEYSTQGSAPRPDLVLLDLRLPRIGGLEVLEEIKRSIELRGIPVIILTTSVAERDVTMAASLRADGYLAKPFDYDEFVGLLNEQGIDWPD